jgi:hypothetical protein
MDTNSHLSIVQTLPSNSTLIQDSGTIFYKKIDSTLPLGVRVLHLLIQQQSGEMEVSVDDQTPIITIKVSSGAITLAFNDTKNISNVVSIDEGNTYTFDDEKREGEISTNE